MCAATILNHFDRIDDKAMIGTRLTVPLFRLEDGMHIIPAIVRAIAAAILCFMMMFGCVPSGGGPGGVTTTNVLDPQQVIALVPDAASERDVRAAADAAGYQELVRTRLNGLGLTMLSFEMAPGVTGKEAIDRLESAVPASVVGVNHVYRLQQQAAATDALDYAGKMMRWPQRGCRARTSVGIIDTRIDTRAPALSAAHIVTRQFFDGVATDADHGTNVATVLAGTDRLTDVTLYGADVFGSEEGLGLAAGADALIRALDWMAEEDVRFVNLALAGPYNKLLDLAVERAAKQGMIMVAAVGNDGPRADPLYPAGFENVIAVTAVDVNGGIYRNAVRGPHVDVAAPGVDILLDTGAATRLVSGTSIATPFVTARLVADQNLANVRSVTDVRARLAATSAELGVPGRDSLFGYGLVIAEGICGN